MKTIIVILGLAFLSFTVSANYNTENDDKNLKSCNNTTETVVEPNLELEAWMLDIDSFNSYEVTAEPEMKLEDWMLDAGEWKITN